jgi:hypothetical protein
MANDNEFKVVFAADASQVITESKKAVTALQSIKPGAAQAGGALISLSRVIQDAPFGFVAIQNNITELIPAFGRLSAATGGPVNALKSLAGSLAGPAGVGFAVSAVTSLITVGIQKYGSLGTAFAALVHDISDAQAALIKYNNAIAESGASVAGEVTEIRSLVAIAGDETLSRAARTEAINKLNAAYPQFHKNLTIENVKTQEIGKSIDGVTDSLIRQAQVKGIADIISKEQAKIAQLQIDPDQALGFLDLLKAGITGAYQNTGTRAVNLFNTAAKNANTEIQSTQKNIDILTGKMKDLLTADAQAGTLFTEPIIKPKGDKGPTLEQVFSKIRDQQGKDWQKLIDESERGADRYFRDLEKNLTDNARIEKIRQKLLGLNTGQLLGITDIKPSDNFKLPIDPLIQFYDRRQQILNKFKASGLNAPDVSWLSDVGAQAQLLEGNFAKLQERAATIGPVITSLLQPAFAQLFDTILSGSQNAFSAVITFLKNLIKQLISTVAAAAALAGVLKLLGLGGGASFGGLFKSLLGIGGGSGGAGGLFSGGGFGFAGGGLSFAGAGLETVVGRISGKDLELLRVRNTGSNGRLGG